MTAAGVASRALWDADVVSLPVVAKAANVPPMDLHNAVRRGQLHTVGRVTASGRPALITREEALAVLAAAALASAAGLVFASALRAVQAGATFPLPTLPEMAAAS